MIEKNGIYKLVTIPEERPGAGGTGLPATRWQVFKAVIKARFGSLVKINLWMLLFALPAILVFFFNVSENSMRLAAMPFSSNAGVGYPYFDDIISQGNHAVYYNSIIYVCLMIPALIIAGVGLAGGFHAVAMLFSGENIPVTKTFFKGVKRNAWQFALIAVPAGASAALLMFYTYYLPVSGLTPFWNIFLLILIILLLVLTLFFVMYLFTQTASYRVKVGQILKNSLAFTLGKFLQNALFLILSILPLSTILFLAGNTFTAFLILFILGLFAFSYLALIWTIHTRSVYGDFFGTAEEAVTVNGDVKPRDKAAITLKAEEPAVTVSSGAKAPNKAVHTVKKTGHKKSKKKHGKK